MMTRLKKLTLFCMCFILVGVQHAVGNPTLILFRDADQKGDDAVAHAIATSFEKLYEEKMGQKTQKLVVNAKNGSHELEEQVKKTADNAQQSPIVIAVGEKSIKSLAQAQLTAGVLTVHVCHMKTEIHPQLYDKIDLIALPFHAVGDIQSNLKGTRTKLIETVGVPHSRTREAALKAIHENKAGIPQGRSYLTIILGGDAPDENNQQQLFTVDNAKALARHVLSIAGDRFIIVTNGPRTGKHSPEKQEIPNFHRDGKVDYVTQAFMDELGQTPEVLKRSMLLDFQFDKTTNEMDQVLGALLKSENSEILIPAESTSSISEAIDVLQGEDFSSSAKTTKVSVYMNSAMNKAHEAHVQAELFFGRINSLLDLNLKEISRKDLLARLEDSQPEILAKLERMQTSSKPQSAADKIASALVK